MVVFFDNYLIFLELNVFSHHFHYTFHIKILRIFLKIIIIYFSFWNSTILKIFVNYKKKKKKKKVIKYLK